MKDRAKFWRRLLSCSRRFKTVVWRLLVSWTATITITLRTFHSYDSMTIER